MKKLFQYIKRLFQKRYSFRTYEGYPKSGKVWEHSTFHWLWSRRIKREVIKV